LKICGGRVAKITQQAEVEERKRGVKKDIVKV